jgi:23S rRNA (cytosine1962-C5)-methyltransferase
MGRLPPTWWRPRPDAEESSVLTLILDRGRDRSVRRRHPWLLASAVARLEAGEGEAVPGAEVRVVSAEGEVLGHGHLSPHSKLRVRLVSFGKEPPPESWLEDRIAAALERRAADPLLGETNALRLVNAEGDGLPGLVADRYGETVVVKLTSAGMAARRDVVGAALQRLTGAASGLERGDPVSARREGLPVGRGVLWGAAPEQPVWIRERERRYKVDLLAGQKTGFYLDQRDARDLVQAIASGRRVLDLFSYTGGFSVAAASGGAAAVTAVDSSAAALEFAAESLTETAPAVPARFEKADAFRFLRSQSELYDLIVVDPPPLARTRGDVKRAARGYKDLILHALRRAAPGARLLVFACSHHMGPELFRKIVFGASLDAERPVRVLRALGPPVDHPVSSDHPEGAYLNGLLLEA